MRANRQIIATRRTLADDIARQFRPLEDSANSTALQASALVVAMLEGHHDAALPPSAGVAALNHVSEAARLATQARAHIAQAHDELRDLPAALGLAFTEPECPPDVVGAQPLRLTS